MNKDTKAAEPQSVIVNAATQKLFKFKRGTPVETIDKIVNQWLRDQTAKGQPAVLGKLYVSFWGTFYIQYLYSVKIEVMKSGK